MIERQTPLPAGAIEILTEDLRARLIAVGLVPEDALREELENVHLADVAGLTDDIQNLVTRVLELRGTLLTDELTGVLNRKGFYTEVARLQAKLLRAQAGTHEPEVLRTTIFAIVFFDIDHFKLVNDTYGHNAGSEILRQLAQRISKNLRSSDFLARWGGDEFVIIARAMNGDALQLAARIQQLVNSEPFDVDGVKIPITLSMGVAAYDQSTDTMVSQADEALYAAKGKRVVCAPDGTTLPSCNRDAICFWDIARNMAVLYPRGSEHIAMSHTMGYEQLFADLPDVREPDNGSDR